MEEGRVLDLGVIATTAELQKLLYSFFDLPGWYGHNWDAFQDSITDPQQSTLPAQLLVRGWRTLAGRLPREAAVLREILDELRAERPECRVVWE